MRQFSLGSAWTSGTAFITREPANHAIILIGIGVAAPLLLQLVLLGGPTGMMNPATLGQGAMTGAAGLAGAFLLVSVLGYILQTGSYFASWRIGLAQGETAGGAIVYGLIAGLLAIVVVVALLMVLGLIVGGVAMSAAGSPGAAPGGAAILIIFGLMVPMLIFFATLYTTMMAAFSVIMLFMLLLLTLFGASFGASDALPWAGAAAGMVGLVGLLLVALLFWLTARFSCATSIMADRKSLNFFGAMSESWRLTAPHQWRILAYLALLGVLAGIGLVVISGVAGVSMMGSVANGGAPEMGVTAIIMSLLFGIPLAYLTVLVPAGIYRELAGTVSAAEVFA